MVERRSSAAAARPTHLSLGRGLRMLEVVAAAGGSATLSEAARKANLARSTAHYVMQTLVALGYLRQDRDSHAYELAAKVFMLAGRTWSAEQLAEIALPFLADVCHTTGESANIAMLRDGLVTLVAKRDADGPVRVVQDVGARRPLHCTALGKVLVAWLPREELSGVLDGIRFGRFTPKTIVQRADFERELRRVRSAGHAIDDEEFIPGVRCIAAPVFSYTEEVVAAIGAIGPRHHMTQQKLRECGPLVQRCARKLSLRLGMPHRD
jgi:DNA-binding IclR family transcriptional regulator